MQTIQIDGTYTYADNIKTIRIGDRIKLIPNPSNRMNAEAIGAYTLSGKKIGYVPFNSNQIDIKAQYTISKINLNQANPILLITMDFPNTNSIHCEPSCITQKKKQLSKFIAIPDDLSRELAKFAKSLEKSGYPIEKIGICELSDSYITICIQTPESTNFFYMVTKSFYEKNIFKYDEFYKFGLVPKCIYIQWQTHRLEKYLELNYRLGTKLFSGKKYSWDNLVNLNIFAGLDPISLAQVNCGMVPIESADLAVINWKGIPPTVSKSDLVDWVKLVIQYNVGSNPGTKPGTKPSQIDYYNPNNLVPGTGTAIKLNLDKFVGMFDNLEPGGLAYNHKLQAYCPIDLSDPINIVEIFLGTEITRKHFIELIGKLVIVNKQIINVYNPIAGLLFRLEISDLIKENFSNIISKQK